MQLTIPVDIPTIADFKFEDRFLLIGSCFTENIAKHMRGAFMQVCANPFGEMYNPLSVLQCMQWLRTDKLFSKNDLIWYNGLFHSMLHHGRFSATDADRTLDGINTELTRARQFIASADKLHIIITFGAAYVYEQNGKVVGNCHKMPESEFLLRRLTTDEIVSQWSKVQQEWNNADFLFTVSPIRYRKYGMHGNQLSKATLLLAIDRLGVNYFPAYEIMLDELRDYRFYADDMIHPSEQAVEYIWQRFCQTCFTKQAQQQITEAESVGKLLNHMTLHEGTAQTLQFELTKTQKINNLKNKYPWIENYLLS